MFWGQLYHNRASCSQGDMSRIRQNRSEITNSRGVPIFMPSLINGVTIDGVTQFTLQN